MNSLRAEILFITGAIMVCCLPLLENNNAAYIAFSFNGLVFVIRSFVAKARILNES